MRVQCGRARRGAFARPGVQSPNAEWRFNLLDDNAQHRMIEKAPSI
jgi:hypothetical protein